LFRKKYDIIHSHDPTGLPPATIYKIFNKKTHFIYDSHEIFPENAKEVVGLPSMLGFFAIELLSSLFFSTIITVAPAMKELLIKRYHPKEGIYLLNSLSQNDVLSIQKIKKSTDFIEIIYAGSIQPHRGYEELIDAVLLLQNEIISNYRIRIIGDGPILANLKERARSKEISSKILSFEGWQEHDTYFKMIGESHIGLSLLHGYTYQQYGIPIKFYEYLFGKLYIIFSDTILSDGEKILQYAKYKEGINESDPKEIAEAVKRAIIIVNSNNNDCLNNRKSESKAKKERFLHNIMWERQSKKLILLYSRLIKN
jgi:glycosyltransferase involved in cell wall biosynthesis